MRRSAFGPAYLVGGVLAVAAMAQPAAAQETVMKYKWTKGQVVHYRVTKETKMKMSGIPGSDDIEGGQLQVLTERLEVTGVDASDGAATVQATFVALKMDSNQPGMPKASYDSANPDAGAAGPSNPIVSLMSGMVGESVTFVILPDGTVRKVDGVDKVWDTMSKGMKGGGPQASMIVQGMKENFTEEGMKRQLEQGFKAIPEKAVKPGETWATSTTQPLSMMGKMSVNGTNTFKGVETVDGKKLARIGLVMTMDLLPPKEGDPVNPMLAMMKPTMKDAKGDGASLFDVGLGQLQSTTMTMTMPVEMSMTGPDGKSMNLKQNITNKVTVERVDAPPPAPAKSEPKKDDKPAEKPADKK